MTHCRPRALTDRMESGINLRSFQGPPKSSEIMRDNLILKVGFCHGDDETYGTEDLPLAFEVNETNTLKLSSSYQFPVF